MKCPNNHAELCRLNGSWRKRNHETGKWSREIYSSYYCPCCPYSEEICLGEVPLREHEEGKMELEDE
jgi:hypothetical protein